MEPPTWKKQFHFVTGQWHLPAVEVAWFFVPLPRPVHPTSCCSSGDGTANHQPVECRIDLHTTSGFPAWHRLVGTGTVWLIRMVSQLTVRPVSYQCQTSVKYRICTNLCHSVSSSSHAQCPVILWFVRSAESPVGSPAGCPPSDAKHDQCPFGCTVLTE